MDWIGSFSDCCDTLQAGSLRSIVWSLDRLRAAIGTTRYGALEKIMKASAFDSRWMGPEI